MNHYNYFEYEYYTNKYQDLSMLNKEQALQHLKKNGIKEKRKFNKLLDLFDYTFYITTYKDLSKMNYLEACNHYIKYGINENRQCYNKMYKLLIENLVPFHYEIIESVIFNYKKILNIYIENVEIFLNIIKNESFKNYILSKYKNITFSSVINYDHYINCTIYNKDCNNIINKSNHKYIAHEITDSLKSKNNVWFLTPLSIKNYFSADILPFTNMKINNNNNNIPIYVIQGNIINHRRNLKLLENILKNNYKYDFKIKLLGRYQLPEILEKYSDKIIQKKNLNFIEYHKEFLDCYCILPLILKKTHLHYYTKKLTSTINYAKAYKLKCLIDNELQSIYNLQDVEIYHDEYDIITKFNNTLINFYMFKY